MTLSVSAARVNEPYSTTATRYSICRKLIAVPTFLVRPAGPGRAGGHLACTAFMGSIKTLPWINRPLWAEPWAMADRAQETEDAHVADVIVIGGGTGGYSTALRAAALGLDVVLVERDLVGGTCLHRGCVPSKAMLHAAELVDGITKACERWGVRATWEGVDWTALTATRDDIVARNHRGVEGRLAHAGVRVVRATATLTGPRTVRVEPGGTWRARRGLVLATGSRPRTLPGLVPDGHRVVTSDDALFAPGLPPSVLVIGGGAIGVEYASLHPARWGPR